MSIDFTKVIAANAIEGEDAKETVHLKAMLDEAKRYLLSFDWCAAIRETYMGRDFGIGGILAVFLFRITPAGDHVDEWLWVIVGDVPPAYITTEDAPNPACALDGYIGAMREWVDAAMSGRSVDSLIPVNVSPTPELAEQLKGRLNFLDKKILSYYQDDLEQ